MVLLLRNGSRKRGCLTMCGRARAFQVSLARPAASWSLILAWGDTVQNLCAA